VKFGKTMKKLPVSSFYHTETGNAGYRGMQGDEMMRHIKQGYRGKASPQAHNPDHERLILKCPKGRKR
jgi:hypothetical protein